MPTWRAPRRTLERAARAAVRRPARPRRGRRHRRIAGAARRGDRLHGPGRRPHRRAAADPRGRTYGGCFDPAFARYARTDDKGNISVRRVDDDRELAMLPGPGHHAYDFDFSDDGRFLLAIYHEVYVIRVWDLDHSRSFEVADPICWDLSPDGRWVASGHKDGTIRIYRYGDGSRRSRLGSRPAVWPPHLPTGRSAPGLPAQEGFRSLLYDFRTGGDRTPPGLESGWGHATWHPGGRDLVGVDRAATSASSTPRRGLSACWRIAGRATLGRPGLQPRRPAAGHGRCRGRAAPRSAEPQGAGPPPRPGIL